VKTIKVSTWIELIEVLYDIPKSDLARYRSSFVYRGLADHTWNLDTSLSRLGKHSTDIEKPLLRNFRKYAQPGSIPEDTLWFTLAAAQHHGLPTRLVDWTTTPKVAMHFATYDESLFDKDAVICCVDVMKAHELLPSCLRDVLYKERAFLFSVEMLEFISTLDELDNISDDDFVFFFEPPSFDARIVNQGAVMSVMPRVENSLTSYLKNHEELYQQIVIPSELKWEVRDKLDQDNVTERMLFPGLDGLSQWLKRYYGLGPNKPS
jgi:hypothetical protein